MPISFENDAGYEISEILKIGESVGLKEGTVNKIGYRVFKEGKIEGNSNNTYLFKEDNEDKLLYFNDMIIVQEPENK